MRNVLFLFAIVIGLSFPQPTKAQTTLLQSLVDATPAGGTLTLPSDVVYPSGAVIGKSIKIRSVGTRLVASKRGDFLVGATVLTNTPEPAITVKPGVDGVLIEGVEIAPTGFVYDLVRIGVSAKGAGQDMADQQPRNILLNNVWVHGLPDQDSQRGVSANGINISITNSRVDEIHAIGVEAQAIIVTNGSGPFLISNNELSAAGEIIMFGGADPAIPNLVPSNITITQNHAWKPFTWKVGDPSFAGKHWTVKNILELKNAKSVTINGNVFDGNWTDAQDGLGILFTVRNQQCTAPWSTVQDVSFTNNIVRNSDGALNLLGWDNEAEPAFGKCPAGTGGWTRGTGVRVANNLFYNIKHTFLQLNGFYNVTVENNTPLQGGNTITLSVQQSTGFVFRNNATIENPYGVTGDNVSPGIPALNTFTPGADFSGNVIARPYAPLPAGNEYPADLQLTSDFRVVGYPGKGANIDALNAAQSGAVAVPTPSPTPNSTPSATPTPSPTPVGTPMPIGIPAGSKVQIVSPANVRESPTINSGVKFIAQTGQTGVTSGNCQQDPASVNIYCLVNFDDGTNGYVAQQFLSVVAAPAPTPTPSPVPSPSPSPSPVPTPAPCLSTNWPTSIDGQNSVMAQRRAQGCYPFRRTKGGMEYARP